jgi:hypothetical protein
MVSIFQGKSKPQRTTSLLLLIICFLSYASVRVSGATPSLWLAFSSFIQSAILWVVSLWFGVGGKGSVDYWCMLLCILGVALWLVSGQSLYGLLASIIADFVSVLPSLLKTIRLPGTESWPFYFIDAAAAMMIVCLGSWSLRLLLYPLYIATINGVFVLIILIGSKSSYHSHYES